MPWRICRCFKVLEAFLQMETYVDVLVIKQHKNWDSLVDRERSGAAGSIVC